MEELNRLQAYIAQGKADMPQVVQLLNNLKRKIFSQPTLLVGQTRPQQMGHAIQLAQITVLHSLATKNLKEFGLNMPRLRMFYQKSQLITQRQNTFKALYLLQQLSQNKLSQFYFELQRFPLYLLQDKQISYVVQLQRSLSSGQYDSIFRQQGNPLIYSQLFVDKIANFARHQIARSIQVAYDSIPINDCARLHHLRNQDQMKAFAKQQIERQNAEVQWIIKDNKICFLRHDNIKNRLESKQKLQMAIRIAQDLQKIV